MNQPIEVERALRITSIEQKLEVYNKTMWSVTDLAVVIGCKYGAARKYFNKVKEMELQSGKTIEVYGKIPKDKFVKHLEISLEKEIKYLELAKKV